MKDITDLQVLQAYEEMWRQRRNEARTTKSEYPEQILMRTTGQPEKVCYRAMERAFGRGLLDYGMWLRGAWITDKGKALLATASAGEPPFAAALEELGFKQVAGAPASCESKGAAGPVGVLFCGSRVPQTADQEANYAKRR